MDTYRFYNDVWTFVLSDVTFKKEKEEFIKIDKIKIVACDGNSKQFSFYFRQGTYILLYLSVLHGYEIIFCAILTYS